MRRWMLAALWAAMMTCSAGRAEMWIDVTMNLLQPEDDANLYLGGPGPFYPAGNDGVNWQNFLAVSDSGSYGVSEHIYYVPAQGMDFYVHPTYSTQLGDAGGNVIPYEIVLSYTTATGVQTVTVYGDLTYAIDNRDNFGPYHVAPLPDTTPPSVDLTAATQVLWPPNHKVRTVTVNGTAADSQSGLASAVLVVDDEYGVHDQVIDVLPLLGPDGSFIIDLSLTASRDGKDRDGRTYSVFLVATDAAGNEAVTSLDLVVPHDQGK